ncbi:MAG: DUF565 domain-containing protein [Merismopedia sp. SIO2A8]|nr:DUF565 domain-containing protein [Merismopedia sp. SIO2A8]
MQNTRLTILVDVILRQLSQWLRNPWRRISVVLVGLLFGNFAATLISTVTGQTADWDVLVALLLLCSCELISWLAYRQRPSSSTERNFRGDARQNLPISPQLSSPSSQSFILEIANAVKIGLVYGLFVEALKLGS